MTLKLYGGERTRAGIIKWYLEETSIPYELVPLDLKAGEHRQPEFLAINPMGKVPAIVDGDTTCWESGAILLYLADHYASTPLTGEARTLLTQWVMFANATLGPGLFVQDNWEREGDRLLTSLNTVLENRSYLVGAELSVADVAVVSCLAYATMMVQLTLDQYPAIATYVKAITARPAFQRTIGA
ncbi:MAG: glutathione S-transferase family protein [Merismopedia sp. SIO2A8]|nr:glutathione S-transferase family protein [Merismopedia sp. SIO2A8]